LKEYIDSQRIGGKGDDAIGMPELMGAWRRASQINDDSTLALIPTCLTLLLKNLSNVLEFRGQGLFLCKTLLQPQQLKLLSRGFTAPKLKDQLILPCLQLLNEIVSYDGGVLAKAVYAQKEFTFKGLGRNLGLRQANLQKAKSEKLNPSIRTHAVQFILANLRLQRPGAKAELLSQRDIVAPFFQHLPEDPKDLLLEILTTLKDHVTMSSSLHRSTRVRLFSGWVLGRIATLYDYEEPANLEGSSRPIRELAHEHLLLLCTTFEYGITHKQNGWYSSTMITGKEPEAQGRNEASLGLEQSAASHKDQGHGSIRNGNVSVFIQNLKPWTDSLHKELLLAIFENVPELVADYFSRKSSFSLDPKAASSWVGNSAFVYSVIQLPVPVGFGRPEVGSNIPPLVSLTLENLLPRPATPSLLTKLIQQSTELVKFYAIRLLVVAFEKLRSVLAMFEIQTINKAIWDDSAKRLKGRFCQRCPKLKDVISVFRGVPETALLQREAFAKLLSSYYMIVPQIALQEKLDISVALEKSLGDTQKETFSPEEHDIIVLELEHLLRIARGSPMMRWLHKPGQFLFSANRKQLRYYRFLQVVFIYRPNKTPSHRHNDQVEAAD
jgi:nucleolar pre-ribosomal-associated protein 1